MIWNLSVACIDLILRATAIVDDDCDEWCGAGRK